MKDPYSSTAPTKAKTLFQILCENMRDGFAVHDIICDADGKPVDYRFIVVNPAFERLTSLKAERIIGRTAREILPEIESYWIETYGRVALEGKPVHFENYSGEIGKHFEVTAFPTGPGQFGCIFHDISDLKRAEGHRQRLEAQLLQAQKLESLGVLAGGIAHDFNNLLAGILGNADLALKDLDPGTEMFEIIKDIDISATRAAELVKQMLLYAGKGLMETRSVDLIALIKEIGAFLNTTVSKKATLHYELADSTPAVMADAVLVRQIVMNLVTNASEALGDKEGVITVSTRHYTYDGKTNRETNRETFLGEDLSCGLYAAIEVEDTGSGMDHETLSRIFDPFFSTKFTGRGMGLAAVLGIVKRHRGAIEATSEPDRGTIVTVLLPATEQAAEAHGLAVSARTGIGKTVLLVDDEESVQSLVRRMLRRLGFTPVSAHTCKAAEQVFKQDPHRFAAVLLDLTMRQKDGAECFQDLSNIREDVPVILSSGYNISELSERYADLGFAGFLQKPYRLAALKDLLDDIVKKAPG